MPVERWIISKALHKIHTELSRLELDCSGRVIICEAGWGKYSLVPTICALANADQVNAIVTTPNTDEAIDDAEYVAKVAGVQEKINIFRCKSSNAIEIADVVLNMGAVRPIDRNFVNQMKRGAVVSLMYESWEFRQGDVDLSACEENGIPVMGTNESMLNLWKFCGTLCIKMMFEAGLELTENKVVIFSRDKFGVELKKALTSVGAEVLVVKDAKKLREFVRDIDALILADLNLQQPVIRSDGDLDPNLLATLSPNVVIIQFCGGIKLQDVLKVPLRIYPQMEVPLHRMAFGFERVGILPFIRYVSGGLKVGIAMHEAKQNGLAGSEFVKHVKNLAPCDPLEGFKY